MTLSSREDGACLIPQKAILLFSHTTSILCPHFSPPTFHPTRQAVAVPFGCPGGSLRLIRALLIRLGKYGRGFLILPLV